MYSPVGAVAVAYHYQTIDKEERKPEEERDEEALVKEVKPMIEEGGRILTEANGAIRGMDPDGRIQANAKHKTAAREASPEEYHLAEVLKEVCVDDANFDVGHALTLVLS